jgi:hypothetical protein
MDALLRTLASEGFWEKALLLIVGAALTGLLVPIVKAWIDRGTFERQKIFEAALARQSDVIKAQTQFLNEFSHLIWEFHKIAQRVSFTRLEGDRKAYQIAVKEYEAAIWDSLSKIRSAIGAARWFCSDAAHKALVEWYDEWFLKVGQSLTGLIQSDPDDKSWSQHHYDVHYGASQRNYKLVRFLAHDFGLRAILESREGKPMQPAQQAPDEHAALGHTKQTEAHAARSRKRRPAKAHQEGT